MSLHTIPASIPDNKKPGGIRYLAIVASFLLASCGGEGNADTSSNSPKPDGQTPPETSTAVWGESNWGESRWQ